MKRPTKTLAVERLEARDVPSAPPAAPYLSAPDLNLAVTNVHYAGPHSSQPVTGTVTVTDPHHATGRFDVVATWAEGVDDKGRPTGRTAPAGTASEVLTAPNVSSGRHGQGFKIPLSGGPPEWARFVSVAVNPSGRVPETRDDDNVRAVPLTGMPTLVPPAGGDSLAAAAPAPQASVPSADQPAEPGGVVDDLNAAAEAVFDTFGDTATALDGGAEAVFDALPSADAVNAASQDLLDLLPHGTGAALGGAVAAGVPGNPGTGTAGTASVGVGVFIDPQEGPNVGEYASYGGVAGGPSASASYPDEPNVLTGDFVTGSYAGVGLSGFLTNAQSVWDLEGPFSTWSADAAFGVNLGSIQVQWGQNSEGQPIWAVSLSPPWWGWGGGVDAVGYQTTTVPLASSVDPPPAVGEPPVDVPGLELDLSSGSGDPAVDPLQAIEDHLNAIPRPGETSSNPQFESDRF